MDEESFRGHVQTALAHLYDYPYLDAHPLAKALRGRTPSGDCGRALRRLIMDAIQDLKPPSSAGEDSASWHIYQCLYLRYLEPKPVVEIARDLYVSDRQERRRHRAAVTALCTVLWQRWTKLTESSVGVALGSLAPDRSAGVDQDETALDTELDRIEMTRSSEVVDVRDVIDSAVATAARLAEIRGVNIVFDYARDHTLAIGNRVVLRQALLGIVVYAIHNSDGDEVSIVVNADPTDCLVSVRFASGRVPEVGREEKDTSDGGLLESDRLLRTQRGTLCTVNDGSGTAIMVRLPQARVRTVLLVDDSLDLLDLFRRYLSGSMYQPVEATSGDEALALARKLRPACIVLDVMMPTRDGWDILQSLRSDPVTRALPVIICSVLRQRELALSLGASGSLTKPVTQRSLLEALDRYCLTVA
jgi:CheY-like chemotaxis protein